jgi:hypothetical protein
MVSEKSKRGGKRNGAGRKSKAEKTAALIADGILSQPNEDDPKEPVLGRPTEYKSGYPKQAEKLCRLGATDLELADFFEVDVRTIYRWAQAHDAFCQALRVGKEASDDRVERSLYNRAVGYSHSAVKIFMPANAQAPVYAPYTEHVAPDVGAASLWLRNRRGDKWRDKQNLEHTGKDGEPIMVTAIRLVGPDG